jgi:hypothetical protein
VGDAGNRTGNWDFAGNRTGSRDFAGSAAVPEFPRQHDAGALALTGLARAQFKDKTTRLIMPGADGTPQVDELHAVLARAAGTEARAE